MSQKPLRSAREISHLQRREIQAPLAASLLRGFGRVMGQAEAIAVATAEIQKEAFLAGQGMAERYGGNTLAELSRLIKEVWAGEDALEYEILEQTTSKLSFDVYRCRYVDLYERLGVKEFGYCLSCCRDEPFARGFNPRIKLLRTQTIMQGASLCDFRFILG